eukprot:SAG31_NODE_1917_length_6923_cov_8.914897_2_plen_88_part_00
MFQRLIWPLASRCCFSLQVLLQQEGYRTVLVNGSSAGVGFYPLNAEQDFGEAHTEIRYSRNVTMFGAKSENNYVRHARHFCFNPLCQ